MWVLPLARNPLSGRKSQACWSTESDSEQVSRISKTVEATVYVDCLAKEPPDLGNSASTGVKHIIWTAAQFAHREPKRASFLPPRSPPRCFQQ